MHFQISGFFFWNIWDLDFFNCSCFVSVLSMSKHFCIYDFFYLLFEEIWTLKYYWYCSIRVYLSSYLDWNFFSGIYMNCSSWATGNSICGNLNILTFWRGIAVVKLIMLYVLFLFSINGISNLFSEHFIWKTRNHNRILIFEEHFWVDCVLLFSFLYNQILFSLFSVFNTLWEFQKVEQSLNEFNFFGIYSNFHMGK